VCFSIKNVTVIVNDGPSSPRSWNGLRVADGMLDVNVKVKIILFDDAVFCVKKGQKPPEGFTRDRLRLNEP